MHDRVITPLADDVELWWYYDAVDATHSVREILVALLYDTSKDEIDRDDMMLALTRYRIRSTK